MHIDQILQRIESRGKRKNAKKKEGRREKGDSK